MSDRSTPPRRRSPAEVDVEPSAAALEFVAGLTDAFGFDAAVDAVVEGTRSRSPSTGRRWVC